MDKSEYDVIIIDKIKIPAYSHEVNFMKVNKRVKEKSKVNFSPNKGVEIMWK